MTINWLPLEKLSPASYVSVKLQAKVVLLSQTQSIENKKEDYGGISKTFPSQCARYKDRSKAIMQVRETILVDTCDCETNMLWFGFISEKFSRG